MSESDNNYFSDDEPISKSHNKLLEAVSNLSKVQHIKKVARKEPSANSNEFGLSKPLVELPKRILPSKNPVSVVDLVETLKGKHGSVGNEIRNVAKTGKILPKPLEKPQADRLMRSITYDKTKKQLQRWDAVVAQFQSAESQTFPLDSETVYINTAKMKQPPSLCLKSDLQIAMEEAEQKLRALKGEKIEKITDADLLREKMLETKNEIKKRRQELRYLKMQQSQKSAKLRLQNKIKSKTYHKLQKQQKLKQQLKEFETLQKLNPEAALEKLQSLEKNRILERANLRHKNTGTWAKNNLVKARYNRDVQKDLSEQLALSRQLTEKKDVSDDEDEDQEDINAMDLDFEDKMNPWMQANGKKTEVKPEDALEIGYRKYWMERKQNEEKLRNHRALVDENSSPERTTEEFEKIKSKAIKKEVLQSSEANVNKEKLRNQSSLTEDSGFGGEIEEFEKKKPKDLKKQVLANSKNSSTENVLKKTKNKKNTKVKAKSIATPVMENGWLIEDVKDVDSDIQSIDNLFDKAEDSVLQKLTTQQKKIKKIIKKQNIKRVHKKEKITKEKDELKNLEDLKFKNQTPRLEIDEELLETATGEKSILPTKPTNIIVSSEENKKEVDAIKHDNYAEVKPKELKTSLAHLTNCDEDVEFDDEDEGVAIERQATINDAFEDDDIVADFGRDKDEEKKALADTITLTMPGWGSWAGTGISEKSTQNRKKLVLDFAKNNKPNNNSITMGRVRINENVNNKKLREHLVSEIPFPFTSVKDYEASIRAPVGRNFVPETAFRALTKPAVITKRGHIIRPMDESELVKPMKRPRSVVEKRILYDANVAK